MRLVSILIFLLSLPLFAAEPAPPPTPLAPPAPPAEATPAAPQSLAADGKVRISLTHEPFFYLATCRYQQAGILVFTFGAQRAVQIPAALRTQVVDGDELLAAVAHENNLTVWWTRSRHVVVLQPGADDKTREAFQAQLSAPDPQTRIQAANQARTLNDARVLPPLLDLWLTPNLAPAVKQAAENALHLYSTELLAALTGAACVTFVQQDLQSDNRDLRAKAAAALYLLASADTAPLIHAAAVDKDSGVRRQAPAALAALVADVPAAQDAAFALLETLLDDKDFNVLRNAADATALLGTPRALGVLEKRLLDPMLNSNICIADALGHYPSPAGVALLAKAIASDSDRVSAFATDGLRYLPPADSLPLIEKALTDKRADVRCGAATFAGRSAGELALPLLEKYLTDPHWNVRCHVSHGLAAVGTDKALALLTKLLQDRDARVRGDVIADLGMFSGQPAVDLILPRLNDRDPNVRAKVPETIFRCLQQKADDILIEKCLNDDHPDVRRATLRYLLYVDQDKLQAALLARLGVEKDPATFAAIYDDFKQRFGHNADALAALEKLPAPQPLPPAPDDPQKTTGAPATPPQTEDEF